MLAGVAALPTTCVCEREGRERDGPPRLPLAAGVRGPCRTRVSLPGCVVGQRVSVPVCRLCVQRFAVVFLVVVAGETLSVSVCLCLRVLLRFRTSCSLSYIPLFSLTVSYRCVCVQVDVFLVYALLTGIIQFVCVVCACACVCVCVVELCRRPLGCELTAAPYPCHCRYCCLVGTFPFNSFLSGFGCCIGAFVFAGPFAFLLFAAQPNASPASSPPTRSLPRPQRPCACN